MLDYYHDKKRVRDYLGIHIYSRDPEGKDKRMLAETIRAQREIELSSNNRGYIPSHRKNLDFFTYFQRQIDKSARKNTRMLDASLSKLKKFYAKDLLPCSLIDEQFCRDFRQSLSKNLSGETPHDYFKIFCSILRSAFREKIIGSLPFDGVPNPKPSSRILSKDILTGAEVSALAKTKCPNDEVKRAFLFCCFTGLRAADVRNLTWKNIDFKNKTIKFKQTKTNSNTLPPLNRSAIFLLGTEGKPHEKVFSLGSQNGVNKSLKSWVEKADINKHITFHCARHTYATLLLIHGADLKTASLLLGHTTTRETEKYTHISEKMKRKAVDALPELI